MKKIFIIILFSISICTNVYANSIINESLKLATELSQSATGVTRGLFVSFTNKTFDIFTTSNNPFSDVKSDDKYYYDILAASFDGYVSDISSDKFEPDAYITKGEVAVLLSNVIDKQYNEQAIKINDLQIIPNDYKKHISKVLSLGIMQVDKAGNFNHQYKIKESDLKQIFDTIKIKELNIKRVDKQVLFKTFDNLTIEGRLSLPPSKDKVEKLVIFVNGTGPNTFENKRLSGNIRFNYFDILADEFIKDDVAFFSYNQRGVSLSDKAPMFNNIDLVKYKTYKPANSAKDIKSMITYLKNDKRLTNAKIYLLGWSEGTIIAPHALVDEGVKVDGLILAGYVNKNLKDALKYQLEGESAFLSTCKYFDCIGKDAITKADFEANPYKLTEDVIGTFEQWDVNKDNVINVYDLKLLIKPKKDIFDTAYGTNNEKYFLNEYGVAITIDWLNAHFAYGNNIDTLKKIDIPIYILQGNYDLNVPYKDALDAQVEFKKLGKNNLNVFIFDKENHDLNFETYLNQKEFSMGFSKIFEIVKNSK